MENIFLTAESPDGIRPQDIELKLYEYFKNFSNAKNILILPPDISRLNSYAGSIVNMLCRHFQNAKVHIMPALGTHASMSKDEIRKMYGPLHLAKFVVHDWRNETVRIGEIPAEFVKEISDGYMDNSIDADINKRLIDKEYDLFISIGQVVPHEIAGFAGYTKNIMIGCGGRSMINQSHYLGALFGMERIMGRPDTPVRKLYNYAFSRFLSHMPLVHVLTVTTLDKSGLKVQAVSIGAGDELFFNTAKVSRDKNLTFLNNPVRKAIAFLDPHEFKTTWLGNKSIYRTRMAIADGGELLVVAPGLSGCGEDPEHDRLIKKYGYIGREEVLKAVKADEELKNNLSVPAHIIHGSSDGRFKITYAPGKMTREEILSINYGYMPVEDAIEMYDINNLKDGFNVVNGEEVFYISNPALGLWVSKSRFEQM